MTNGSQKGFWSYVHVDDAHESGRIIQLAHDIVGEYEAITASSISLFIDREDISWGTAWRDAINGSLADVAFFIPVVTPRFLESPECRREFEEFERHASRFGARKLIMPILYMDVPGLRMRSEDRIAVSLEAIQYENWTELRFAGRKSEAYRRAVNGLANQLVSRVAAVDAADVLAQVSTIEDDEGDTWLDKLAASEEGFPVIQSSLKALTSEMGAITTVMKEATNQLREPSGAGATFAKRLTIARAMAVALDPHVDEFEALASTYASAFAAIDGGVSYLLETVAAKVAGGEELGEHEVGLVVAARRLIRANEGQYAAAVQTQAAMRNLATISRDLKPRAQRIGAAVTQMSDVKIITDGWSAIVVELPDYPEPELSPDPDPLA